MSAVLLHNLNSVLRSFINVNVHLKDKPDWFLAKTPCSGKVPVIEVNGHVITESLVTSEYLDDKFTGCRTLSPSSLEARAKDKAWLELAKSIIGPMHASIKAQTDDERSRAQSSLTKGLDMFETELEARATLFFGGASAPGMLDYMIWPWFERFQDLVQPTHHFPGLVRVEQDERVGLDSLTVIFQTKWMLRMSQDGAVQAYSIPKEIHLKFFQDLVQGKQDYDMMANLSSSL